MIFKKIIFIFALATCSIVNAVEPDEVLANPKLEERARQISKDLRCLVCQNESIDESDAALARDLRVIIIKFADRLNNMETIQYLSSNKRKEIALETKEIFVPLAHRLGMAKLKWQLEDLSLKCLDLRAFNSIKKKIETSTRLNEDILSNAIRPIKSELSSYKIKSNNQNNVKVIIKNNEQ